MKNWILGLSKLKHTNSKNQKNPTNFLQFIWSKFSFIKCTWDSYIFVGLFKSYRSHFQPKLIFELVKYKFNILPAATLSEEIRSSVSFAISDLILIAIRFKTEYPLGESAPFRFCSDCWPACFDEFERVQSSFSRRQLTRLLGAGVSRARKRPLAQPKHSTKTLPLGCSHYWNFQS